MSVHVSGEGVKRLLLHRLGLLEWQSRDGASGRLWRDDLRAPADTLAAIRRLQAVQLDPVAVVERNHHLVLYNRVGGYQPRHLALLYEQKQVFEEYANARCILPIEQYPHFRVKMQMRDELYSARWRGQLDGAVRYVIDRLETEGPLPARKLESPDRVHGYWDNHPKTKATSQALEHLWEIGEVVVALRNGDERTYALARHWLPVALSENAGGDAESAWEHLIDHYLAAFGIVDTGDPRLGWRNRPVAERRTILEARARRGDLIPLKIEGARRLYYVSAAEFPLLEALSRAEIAPRVSLLPPLDNLLWSRPRLVDLFHFQYTWEIYIPKAKRRLGAYGMPILEGDRLIGRIDPRMDRASGVLVIQQFALEPGIEPTPDRMNRLRDAMHDFARFHDATSIESGAEVLRL